MQVTAEVLWQKRPTAFFPSQKSDSIFFFFLHCKFSSDINNPQTFDSHSFNHLQHGCSTGSPPAAAEVPFMPMLLGVMLVTLSGLQLVVLQQLGGGA